MPQPDPTPREELIHAIATSETLTALSKNLATGIYEVAKQGVANNLPPVLQPIVLGEIVALMAGKFVEDNRNNADNFRQLINAVLDIAEGKPKS